MTAFKPAFCFVLMVGLVFQSCQMPEHGYCSVTLIDEKIEESPSIEAVIEEGSLQIICSFTGMDILDTFIELTPAQNDVLWAEVERQNFKTYYKDGPEWQTKQTNLQDINASSNDHFKTIIFDLCPVSKLLIDESLQKAKKILPPTVPIVPPIDTRDTLSAD